MNCIDLWTYTALSSNCSKHFNKPSQCFTHPNTPRWLLLTCSSETHTHTLMEQQWGAVWVWGSLPPDLQLSFDEHCPETTLTLWWAWRLITSHRTLVRYICKFRRKIVFSFFCSAAEKAGPAFTDGSVILSTAKKAQNKPACALWLLWHFIPKNNPVNRLWFWAANNNYFVIVEPIIFYEPINWGKKVENPNLSSWSLR